MEKAKQIVAYVGPSPRFPGQKALIYGMYLTAELLSKKDPETILATKELYPRIACELGCSVNAAEKQLYCAVNSCWMGGDNEALMYIAGKQLPRKPKAMQFLIYCAHYYLNDVPYHLGLQAAFSNT